MSKRIYVNGTVITADEENHCYEAIAIDEGKIIGLGTGKELLEQFGDGAQVVDLEGKTILPGFYDAHSHINQVALYSAFVNLEAPPVGKINTIEGCIEALLERKSKIGEKSWIFACGFSENGVKEKRGLTRRDLDKVSKSNPIYVLDKTLHYAFVNSVTLDLAGINETTKDPVGGRYCREDDRKTPNGILEEEAARDLVKMFNEGRLGNVGKLPNPIEKVSDATLKYASVGITTANDGGTLLKDIPTYICAAKEGKLYTRVVFNPYWPYREKSDEEYLRDIAKIELDEKWLHMGGIKHMYDGTIQNMSAYLSEPYYTANNGDKNYCGYPSIEKEKMLEEILFLHHHGMQILIHCNGDAAIEDVLDMYEIALRKEPDPNRRHMIIHAQTIREDQIQRAKKMGIMLSLFPPHIYYYGNRHRDTFLGANRAYRLSPAKSLVEQGMKFSIHCDTPVFPQNPLQTIWTAVNRMTLDGEVLGEEQRIPVMEAIKAYTIYSAYQHGEEKERGSLEIGKYADLVVLGENPLTCDKQHIKDIKVVETVIAGKRVYPIQ